MEELRITGELLWDSLMEMVEHGATDSLTHPPRRTISVRQMGSGDVR